MEGWKGGLGVAKCPQPAQLAKPVRDVLRQEGASTTSTVAVYVYSTGSFRQPTLLFSCIGSNLDQKAKPKGL